jgi:hypothetical protein
MQFTAKPELPLRTRLWIYGALWIVTGIAFAVAVQFMPGEGYPSGGSEWWYHLSEGFKAFVSAPLEIPWGLGLASPRGILFLPGFVYLGLNAYLSLSFRRRSFFIVLCAIHFLVTSIAIVALIQHTSGT